MTCADEYTLALTQVNSLAERRQAVTATYLSVNAALNGAIAFLFKDGQLPDITSKGAALILLFSGFVACGLWRRLISHYSTLIGWWYEQLRSLEKDIPESNKLITKEFELYSQEKRKKFKGITPYELRLTWLFTIIYAVFGLALLATLVLSHI